MCTGSGTTATANAAPGIDKIDDIPGSGLADMGPPEMAVPETCGTEDFVEGISTRLGCFPQSHSAGARARPDQVSAAMWPGSTQTADLSSDANKRPRVPEHGKSRGMPMLVSCCTRRHRGSPTLHCGSEVANTIALFS